MVAGWIGPCIADGCMGGVGIIGGCNGEGGNVDRRLGEGCEVGETGPPRCSLIDGPGIISSVYFRLRDCIVGEVAGEAPSLAWLRAVGGGAVAAALLHLLEPNDLFDQGGGGGICG
jgi:hypothetical protein